MSRTRTRGVPAGVAIHRSEFVLVLLRNRGTSSRARRFRRSGLITASVTFPLCLEPYSCILLVQLKPMVVRERLGITAHMLVRWICKYRVELFDNIFY